jgi:hypothetical protein
MSRDELVAKARALGVERAELMTRVELHDEIVRRSEPDPGERKKARGWLGVARDLVAGVVESGLNLPDAAALIRGRGEVDAQGPSPVATVTLAQIYAAQGHHARAIAVLDEVLAKEPDHPAARALRERFLESPPAVSKPVEPQVAIPSFDVTPVDALETAEPPLAPLPEQPPEPVLDETALGPPPATVLAPMPVMPAAAAPDVDAPPIVVTPPPRTATRPPCVLVTRSAGVRPEVVWDLGDLPGPGAGVALAIRYVSWTPSPSGVDRRDGELFVNERRGRKRLAEVDPRAVVRVVFGHGRNDDFVPLGIASELAVRDGSVDLRFRPPTATDAEIQPFERELALGAAS